MSQEGPQGSRTPVAGQGGCIWDKGGLEAQSGTEWVTSVQELSLWGGCVSCSPDSPVSALSWHPNRWSCLDGDHIITGGQMHPLGAPRRADGPWQAGRTLQVTLAG